ncbi:hypothetical protein ACJJTC_019112 [Scirpophaga incertulas]
MSRCVNCSLSLVHPQPRRQVGEITDVVLRILQSWINPATVHRLERVCLPCWTSAYRTVRRQYDQSRQQLILEEEAVTLQGNVDVPTTSRQQLVDASMSSRDPSIPTPPPQPEHQLHHVMNVICNPKIVSRIYKRAAASSRHCIFSECEHTERVLVPSIIKEMLLLDHKLYIPASTRICSHHLNMGAWGELQFHYNDFTGSQMDDMMSIMDRASRRQFGFSNIREMHPHLCHYWLGINPEQFYQLLSHIPQLTHEVPCPSQIHPLSRKKFCKNQKKTPTIETTEVASFIVVSPPYLDAHSTNISATTFSSTELQNTSVIAEISSPSAINEPPTSNLTLERETIVDTRSTHSRARSRNSTQRHISSNAGSSTTSVINYLKNRDASKANYDDIDHICLGYAKTIKKFPAERQALVKFQMAKLLMEQELEHIHKRSPITDRSTDVSEYFRNFASNESNNTEESIILINLKLKIYDWLLVCVFK